MLSQIDMELIFSIIMAAIPSIATGIIVFLVKSIRDKIISKFQDVAEKVSDTKDYKELKNELALAHEENRELKKAINELLTKIDKIHRSEE